MLDLSSFLRDFFFLDIDLLYVNVKSFGRFDNVTGRVGGDNEK